MYFDVHIYIYMYEVIQNSDTQKHHQVNFQQNSRIFAHAIFGGWGEPHHLSAMKGGPLLVIGIQYTL